MVETTSKAPAFSGDRTDDDRVVSSSSVVSPEASQSLGHQPQEINVRRLRLRDLRHLVSNYRLVHVDMPDSLVERGGPLTDGLRGLQPFGRSGPITHLAFSETDQFWHSPNFGR